MYLCVCVGGGAGLVGWFRGVISYLVHWLPGERRHSCPKEEAQMRCWKVGWRVERKWVRGCRIVRGYVISRREVIFKKTSHFERGKHKEEVSCLVVFCTYCKGVPYSLLPVDSW